MLLIANSKQNLLKTTLNDYIEKKNRTIWAIIKKIIWMLLEL